GAGNVIAKSGISINSGVSGTIVRGNFIGTNSAGAAGLGSTSTGIFITNSAGNTIGGTASGERNVIAASATGGIAIFASTGTPASNNIIEGNYIGTKPDGVTSLGNGNDGIALTQSGTGSVSGNTIRNNVI